MVAPASPRLSPLVAGGACEPLSSGGAGAAVGGMLARAASGAASGVTGRRWSWGARRGSSGSGGLAGSSPTQHTRSSSGEVTPRQPQEPGSGRSTGASPSPRSSSMVGACDRQPSSSSSEGGVGVEVVMALRPGPGAGEAGRGRRGGVQAHDRKLMVARGMSGHHPPSLLSAKQTGAYLVTHLGQRTVQDDPGQLSWCCVPSHPPCVPHCLLAAGAPAPKAMSAVVLGRASSSSCEGECCGICLDAAPTATLVPCRHALCGEWGGRGLASSNRKGWGPIQLAGLHPAIQEHGVALTATKGICCCALALHGACKQCSCRTQTHPS
jgi:hypothetical protein